jgi:hypothetical protein
MDKIKCGHCKDRHDTRAQVRLCAKRDWEARAADEEAAAQAHAEYLAEQRNERYFEEGSEAFQATRFMEEQYEAMRLGL